jgi:hypothetical protein
VTQSIFARLALSLISLAGLTFVAIQSSQVASGAARLKPNADLAIQKVGKIYDENESYVLFSSVKPGSLTLDRKIWVRFKKTGLVRLATDHARFGIPAIVLAAVLANGIPTAYALVRSGGPGSVVNDSIFAIQLVEGQANRVLNGTAYKIGLIEGIGFDLSPDNRFLAFAASYQNPNPVKNGPNYPVEALFRFGPLNSPRPGLEKVLPRSTRWPCTGASGDVIPCKTAK